MTLRRTTMRPAPPVDRRSEPGYSEWKKPVYGRCANCGEDGHLIRHHVVRESDVRAIDETKAWCLSNSLLLGMWCKCHSAHHSAASRLPRSIIPAEAVQFAIELLGQDGWELYAARHYRSEP